jgi:uncharacterized membrane protein
MRALALGALLIAATGCAVGDPELEGQTEYQARGAGPPAWVLSIGTDRTILETGEDRPQRLWSRATLTQGDGVRTWRAGRGRHAIVIEARAALCSNSDGTYQDSVSVRFDGRTLAGCGGWRVQD